MKKRVCYLLFVSLIIMSFTGCGENQVASLNAKIDKIISAEEITQQQLNEVFTIYEKLSVKQQEKIINYDKIEKYKDVDIQRVNEINNAIKHTSSFNELLKLQQSIDELNLKEKALINTSVIEDAMALTELDKAGIAACQCIKKSIKNSSSFELQSIKVINDLEGKTKYYLVKIEYSATNSFGGRIDNSSFQTISEKFENPWFGLAILTGKYEEAIKCSSFLEFYLLHDDEPVELDCEKILYYIDEDVSVD